MARWKKTRAAAGALLLAAAAAWVYKKYTESDAQGPPQRPQTRRVPLVLVLDSLPDASLLQKLTAKYRIIAILPSAYRSPTDVQALGMRLSDVLFHDTPDGAIHIARALRLAVAVDANVTSVSIPQLVDAVVPTFVRNVFVVGPSSPPVPKARALQSWDQLFL